MTKLSSFSIKSAIGTVSAIISNVFYSAITQGISPVQAGALAARGNGQPLDLFGVAGIFTTLSDTAMFLIGALAVLMLIFGGFKYVISGGDSAKVTSAKNTILYAIVGIIVASLAFAAVNFVTTSLAGSGGGGTNI